MTVLDRFLKYVKVETTSCEENECCPSMQGQKALGAMLAEEMRSMGIADAEMDGHGYVYGTIPAKGDAGKPAIGLIAHMDTSDGVKGPTDPQMIRDYAVTESDVVRMTEIPADLKRQLASSKERTVRLPHGGNIVIDRCEAMTVIDVNSASAAYPGDKEASVTSANLEACAEAAVQVRLRDIAGIILIDFIDMEKETDRSLVEERLKEVFRADRRKTVIHGWTKLGIMEMTRKRI